MGQRKTGKTLTTFLVDGEPEGPQYSFISNKICQMYVVPRSKLAYLNEQESLQRPAFYILVGADREAPQAYIGETENFRERVKDHDSKKIFWQKALIFVSRDAILTKADVQYLEYLAVKEALEAKRFSLDDNKQIPKKPNLPEYQRNTMDEFFQDIKLLASFAGYNIFEITNIEDHELFYVNRGGTQARGIYNTSGFTVLKGSLIRKECISSYQGNDRIKREHLIRENATEKGNNGYILNNDLTFSSPSTAAGFCVGGSANGWKEWKNKEGKTLHDVHRLPLIQSPSKGKK